MDIHMYEFFEEHNILYKLQFGFRKKMSTGHSLVEITEEIKESIDNGKFGCGIFIDLKKLLIQLIIVYYSPNLNTMVSEDLFWNGLNPILAIEDNMSIIMV